MILFLEQRDKPQDTLDDPLGEMEMANVIARKQQRTGNKVNSTAYSSNEVNIHIHLFSYLLYSSSSLFSAFNRNPGN